MKTAIISLTILLFGAGSCGKLRGEPLKKPFKAISNNQLPISYYPLVTITV